jgi:hypothetical protein
VTQLNLVNIDGTNSPVALTFGTLSIFHSQFITAAPNVTSTTVTGSLFQNNPGLAHCEHRQCPMHEQRSGHIVTTKGGRLSMRLVPVVLTPDELSRAVDNEC